MEKKGLWMNMGYTKITVSGMNLDLLKESGMNPCCVRQTRVGSNAIFCGRGLCWIHKKCNGPDPNFRCPRCLETEQPIIERTVNDVKADNEKLMANLGFCSRPYVLCF